MAVTRLHRNSDPIFDLYMDQIAKTTNYTIVAADNGKLFTNEGASAAVVFTLPALGIGYKFGFLVIADQNLKVQSAAGDDIVTKNDAAADSLSFETANEKIGGYLEFFSNAAGDKWFVKKLCENTVTVVS